MIIKERERGWKQNTALFCLKEEAILWFEKMEPKQKFLDGGTTAGNNRWPEKGRSQTPKTSPRLQNLAVESQPRKCNPWLVGCQNSAHK